jgi:predicted RNA-binding protein with PUA domain
MSLGFSRTAKAFVMDDEVILVNRAPGQFFLDEEKTQKINTPRSVVCLLRNQQSIRPAYEYDF